jgi:protein-disulfide isomerase
MAKQQRGSTRTTNRPAEPAPTSGKPSGGSSSKPSGQKSSQGSTGTWQPNKVSSSKKSGPNRTLLFTLGAIIVGVLIVVVVAAMQLGGNKGTSANDPLVTPGGANLTPTTIPVNGLTLGNADAKATIDLYGDFRCSACYSFTEGGTATQINKQLVATGQAKIVWHDFTVIDKHDGATASRDAANAAWCAADQNKFWTMHDWLYANQSPTEAASAFSIDRLLKIGEAAGMDMTTFTPCVKNGTHNAEIAAEEAKIPSVVSGTPATIVNGALVNSTFAALQKAVADANGASASPSGN